MADWTDLIGPLLGTAGSVYASNQAANATTNAANAAAQAAQFRPVGVTTRFGKSGFQYDPATGQLIGAGYQVAPDVAAMREGLMGLAGTGISQAQGAQAQQAGITRAGQGLFNLGQSYIGQNPQQVAQNWLSQQQQLLAPGREQQLAQLTNQQQQQGRLGLAVGATSAGYTANQPQQQQQPMSSYPSMGNNFGGMQPFIGSMPPMGSPAAMPQMDGLAVMPQISQEMRDANAKASALTALQAPTNYGGAENMLEMMKSQQGGNTNNYGGPGGPAVMPQQGGNMVNTPSATPDFNSPYFAGFSAPMPQQGGGPVSAGPGAMPFGPNEGGLLPGQEQLGRGFDGTGGGMLPFSSNPSDGPYMPQPAIMPQQSSMMPAQQSQGLQATNPQMAAYYNAMAQQDAQLAANAQAYGNQQVQFGQGLMTGGLNLQGQGYGLQTQALAPYTNYMAGATNIENQGLNALTQGSGLGSSITAGSTAAANIQNQAAQQAAALQLQRNNAIVGGLTDPVSQLIGSLSGSTAARSANANAAINPYFQTIGY